MLSKILSLILSLFIISCHNKNGQEIIQQSFYKFDGVNSLGINLKFRNDTTFISYMNVYDTGRHQTINATNVEHAKYDAYFLKNSIKEYKSTFKIKNYSIWYYYDIEDSITIELTFMGNNDSIQWHIIEGDSRYLPKKMVLTKTSHIKN